MEKANKEVRRVAKESRVTLWQIAARMNRSYSWITQKIRIELSEKEKNEMLAVIDAIAGERNCDDAEN